MCHHPFLAELWGPFVLRDLEQLHGAQFVAQNRRALSHGMLGGAPGGPASPRRVHVLGHFVALVDTMAMGWRRAMAAAPQWCLQLRIIQNTFDAKSLREL